MPEVQDLRQFFVSLYRHLEAERLGNTSHADAIA